MRKPSGLVTSLMLAPLLGVTDTLPKALSFLGLSTLIVALYAGAMHVVRARLSPPMRLIASLMLAATLVASAQVLLTAFALSLYLQLGGYLALISVQCVVLEYSGFFDASQHQGRLQLFGLFGASMLILGLLRDVTDITLVPAGFILLGLLLAGCQAWTQYLKSR
ncbi:Rnf-Nqr domain containing protein [Pseudomonas extremaustralis]|uniref:Rnf-Nqr domain containing protein n=1 Tax=Pseudomonas extremaustralis TaxID=359110 RepID=UPI002AA77037|nr:Rnf-Nqr domain containing protein [Pseudomonas extremaustralis]